MASGKKARKNVSQWGWRLAGIVLCAFFALGVMTGLSRPGRVLGTRLREVFEVWSRARHFSFRAGDIAAGRVTAGTTAPLFADAPPVALVERADGFYTLSPLGELRGPVSPPEVGDLPVLSGAAMADAGGSKLLRYAAALVRAEADLSTLVSEMRVDDDDTAILFLEGSQTRIVFEIDDAAIELAHAARVMRLWRGREQMVAALDVTTPGQAVVQFRNFKITDRAERPVRKIALAERERLRARRNPAPEGIVR